MKQEGVLRELRKMGVKSKLPSHQRTRRRGDGDSCRYPLAFARGSCKLAAQRVFCCSSCMANRRRRGKEVRSLFGGVPHAVAGIASKRLHHMLVLRL